jgi:hypothetical protein
MPSLAYTVDLMILFLYRAGDDLGDPRHCRVTGNIFFLPCMAH